MEMRRCAACGKAFRHVASPGSDVLQCIDVSTCATATQATGQAAERCRLPREPGAGAARVGSTPSRLLARVSAHASPVLREQSPCGATAATRASAGRGAVCKDGRVNGVFARAFRDLSAGAGECRRVCKDGRVGRGNDFDINTIRGSGGGLQRVRHRRPADPRCMKLCYRRLCAASTEVDIFLVLVSPAKSWTRGPGVPLIDAAGRQCPRSTFPRVHRRGPHAGGAL